ncbi:hypothetical protein SAY87_005116 [Trapa incisa]|uniref:Homeobox-leucine zipper protein n=1 Tax=Trapa incisa TaxID=236973 RepID=A0AAN7JPV4_9MYRT|nr:hypothetical protein SAY87_005116 [Trapa incisa]
MDLYERGAVNRQQQQQPSRHRGKRLAEGQVSLLEKSFSSYKKLDPERKLRLAAELGVPPRQVAIWYQNKRARWKTQSLEIECSTLQVKLESTVAEKMELEKDVDRLRTELKKAREMLALAGLNHHHHHHHGLEQNSSHNNNNNLINISASCSNTNVVSGSCEELSGGSPVSNNSINEEDHGRHVRSCCWEDQDEINKTLHLDDLYACVMFASGSAGRSDN